MRSRSFTLSQLPQAHRLSERVSSSFFIPQQAHSLDDGNHRLASMSSAPYQAHLYFSLDRKPERPASAKARASLRFSIIPATFSVSTTHLACRLGYRRRCLVMVVIADVDHPGMDLTPLVVPLLSPVGRIAFTIDIPAAGNGLIQASELLQSSGKGLGIVYLGTVRTHCHGPHANVHTDGWSVLHRWRWLPVLNAEAGEPCSRRPVDSHLTDRPKEAPKEPQMFHHGHPSDPGQDYHLGVHPHRVGAVIGAKALLMLAPLVARKPDSTAGISLPPVFRYSPHREAVCPKSMMAYLAAFWDNSRPQGAMMSLTVFHLGRRDLSESHSSTCKPAWNSPTAQLYAKRA